MAQCYLIIPSCGSKNASRFYFYHSSHIFLTIKLKYMSCYLWNNKLYFFLEYKMVSVIFFFIQKINLMKLNSPFFKKKKTQCFLKVNSMPGQSTLLSHLVLIDQMRKPNQGSESLRLAKVTQLITRATFQWEDRYKSNKPKAKTKQQENMSQ